MRECRQFDGSEYWKQVISEIELAARLKSRNEFIRSVDYSVTLPTYLRNRVAKILPYDFDEYDRNVYIDDPNEHISTSSDVNDDSDDDVFKRDKRKGVYNESTCSEVERLENEFPRFEIKYSTPIKRKLKTEKKIFWCSKFICKQRKERVKWNSKIYQMESSIWEKTLDEQAEQLMDASAERFTEWLNSLGSNHDSDISKERLKSLFSIEGDRKLLASIQTEPKEVKAIAQTVADKWNLPQMAIELKYESYINSRLKNVPKKVRTVAFGSTIPYRYRPWVPSSSDTTISTVFPEELLTGQKLFKGIRHLRSTRALVEVCRRNSNFEKPQYLVEGGMFKQKAKTATKQEVPLYERLKLTY